MKVIPLKEDRFAVNKQKEFTRLQQGERIDDGRLKMAIQPFLIQTDNDIILFDLGLGIVQDGKPLMYKLLEDEGVFPHQITKIVLSHLHKDHLDGIGHFSGNEFIPHFPESTIYIQKREFDFALTQKESYSYNSKVLESIPFLTNIVWMEEDKGQITGELFFEVTGGHTPFHQVFWMKGQQTVFYAADNLPQKGYLDYAIAYKTDYDGKHAMELRKEWQTLAEKEHWMVLLYHDMKTPILYY